MRVGKVFIPLMFFSQLLLILVLQENTCRTDAAPQQPTFSLPVELIGFPVIIIAVRLSNFVRKLAYSLNPRTYMSRVRREAITNDDEVINVVEAEKRLVAEMGEHVCIYKKVCIHYAERARQNETRNTRVLDWENILSSYKRSPNKDKEFYLLSVFLGDIVASPKFCTLLEKRGRACKEEFM